MSNLFILGNGFDLAHGLKTSYGDFRDFLLNELEPFSCLYRVPILGKVSRWYTHRFGRRRMPVLQEPPIYTGKPGESVEKIYNIDRDGRFICWMIDDAARRDGKLNKWDKIEWNQFEKLLGKIDYEKIVKGCSDRDDIYASVRSVQESLEWLFAQWFNTIDLAKCHRFCSLCSVLDPVNDWVLTFNYTETMEAVYGVDEKHVCHIHGARETDRDILRQKQLGPFGKYNEKLYYGYGIERNEKDIDEHIEKKYESFDPETRGICALLDANLVKDTDEIIKNIRNCDFYESINNDYDIEHIYSYGFSFEAVDEPQIRELIKSLNRDTHATRDMVWHLSAYDERRGSNSKYRRIIRSLGFEGKFGEPLDLSNSGESASEEEYQMLRTEILQYMEEYQSVRNMMYLVTVAILALNGIQLQNQYLFLLPLAVILPSYLVYFDYYDAVLRAATYLQVFYEGNTDAIFHWETRSAELSTEIKLRKYPSGGSRQRICYYACALMCFACYIGDAMSSWLTYMEDGKGNILSLVFVIVIGLMALFLSILVFAEFGSSDKDRMNFLTAWEKVKN